MTQRSPPNQANSNFGAQSLAAANNENICSICEKAMMFDSQECDKILNCSHIFHRVCVEQALSTSAECPHCRLPCELTDLRIYNAQSNTTGNTSIEMTTRDNIPNVPKRIRQVGRGKGRGAMASRPMTRNLSKALFADRDGTPRQSLGNLVEMEDQFSPRGDINSQSVSFPNIPDNDDIRLRSRTQVEIDYSRIDSMIENSISRIFRNLNLQSNPFVHPTQGAVQDQPVPIGDAIGGPEIFLQSNGHRRRPSSGQIDQFIRPEKLTAIIQNWNVKFDGSSTGLTVEEFLYRVKSLTQEHFENNFAVICKNLPVLLTGKAREWYWRYHKQVDSIEWTSFCAALKCQFKDMRSSFELKEEIRNRKMRPGENFETFYDSVCSILDRLAQPLPEEELVEILVRNLRPEIRHELLYVPIFTIAHLRNLVQKREKLFEDESYRRNTQLKQQFNPSMTNRRNIAEVEQSDEFPSDPNTEVCVDAVNYSANPPRCWNCDQTGHFWDDCVQPRTVFCYGCGTKKVYKPQCVRCAERKLAVSKNFIRQNQPQKQT